MRRWVLVVLMFLPSVAWAQQPSPTCESQLAACEAVAACGQIRFMSAQLLDQLKAANAKLQEIEKQKAPKPEPPKEKK